MVGQRRALIEPPKSDVAEAEAAPGGAGEVVDQDDAVARDRSQLVAGLVIGIETRDLRREIPEPCRRSHVRRSEARRRSIPAWTARPSGGRVV